MTETNFNRGDYVRYRFDRELTGTVVDADHGKPLRLTVWWDTSRAATTLWESDLELITAHREPTVEAPPSPSPITEKDITTATDIIVTAAGKHKTTVPLTVAVYRALCKLTAGHREDS